MSESTTHPQLRPNPQRIGGAPPPLYIVKVPGGWVEWKSGHSEKILVRVADVNDVHAFNRKRAMSIAATAAERFGSCVISRITASGPVDAWIVQSCQPPKGTSGA